MSPKPEPLNTSSSAVERDHHPSHSIQSLPIPAATSNNRFGASLPALQDPRYSTTSSSGYDSSSPTSAASSIAYSPFATTNVFSPTSYPTSASSSSYPIYSSMASESRPRIPSIQSPTSGMNPHHRSSSGSTKSVSPSLGSSVRADYATSTPHLGRHLPTRGSQSDILSPHSPLTPVSRTLDSPTITVSPTVGGLQSPMSNQHDPTSNGLGANNTSGPPLGETQYLHQLNSADGHLVRPEIHARVDKGFFLSERDWTCYRRNYFSVVCSYSLTPSTHSLPLYLRRNQNSTPDHVLAFAMCISAVVDAPGGKVVDLVQHTPKRDKGPQHKPNRIKLSPQPAGGMSFASSSSSPAVQQPHSPQPGNLEHEYSFPQTQQQQQHIAVFDRIQFKSATANNGKRRAAQQYYHLIVELYADIGSSASSGPSGHTSNPGPDGGWVKIAYRISAPMVVRGRSPGHYADERRTSASSPGAGGGAGNGNGAHPSPTSGGSGFMGADGVTSAQGPGGSNSSMGMSGMQLHTSGISSMHSSPTTASVHNPSISSASSSHMEPPIDPILDTDSSSQLDQNFVGYQYYPATLYESQGQPPPQSIDSGYDSHSYSGDRKSEHSLETNCHQYDSDVSSYIPASMPSGDSMRKTTIKDEFSTIGQQWLGREQQQRYNLFPKCGRFDSSESSRGYYPDLSAL
ncbi:p53-like transcription factor [Morchella conica CCBAS932]|uniref:p53-like transcription factor n=2 Tax=Morchella sect. Distantes TaxID=1051054 RepID=A0A3N4KDP9_9PEZI|nr:p53-like transcription factor [Morchella conica CCBAS932]